VRIAKVVIDFETYSDVDISIHGAHVYCKHPSTRILCMSYKIVDGEAISETLLWSHDKPFPEGLLNLFSDKSVKVIFYAFNATFEILVWNNSGNRDFPQWFKPVKPSDFIDAQALCARYGFPLSLKNAAKATNCKTEKMETGKSLIVKCCTPGGNPTAEDYQNLYEYCRADTEVTYELIQRLPADHLSDTEQKLWELTFDLNHTGVPIDIEAVNAITDYLSSYSKEMKTKLPSITEKFMSDPKKIVTSPGQVKRIKEYCEFRGVKLDNLQSETVSEILEREDIPEDVEQVLTIRQLAGLSSVSKYVILKNYFLDGRVHDTLFYHGAGPGRWAGRNLQYQNLPKVRVDDPDFHIQRFLNKEQIEKPMMLAKKLIRPMIKAPDGYQLIVSDYSSIENRVAAWLSNDEAALTLFREGRCQYSDMAAAVYNVPVEQIVKGSTEYSLGKMLVLGCGYQMGAKVFQRHSLRMGFNFTIEECEFFVKTFRKKYRLLTYLWYAYSNAAKMSVAQPGVTYTTNKCAFKTVNDRIGTKWLVVTLPSGRNLLYRNPEIIEGMYGLVVQYTKYSPTKNHMYTKELSPGLITENIDQGTARDVLAHGMLNLVGRMPEVQLCISVHDEAGGLIKEEDIHSGTMQKFNDIMCTKAPWCADLPLKAEGYIGKRYKKD